jgi:transposase-like protein
MKHILSTTKDRSTWAVTPWMAKWPTTTVGAARRRRWTAAEKARFLRAFVESGLSVSKFSRKVGVPLSTLYQWQQHAERGQSKTARPAFAEVRVAGPALGTTASVHLPCGARLEAAVGTDPDWLAAIIKAAVAG